MKYEAPELNALTAINAIQQSPQFKGLKKHFEFIQPGSPLGNETAMGYEDWE